LVCLWCCYNYSILFWLVTALPKRFKFFIIIGHNCNSDNDTQHFKFYLKITLKSRIWIRPFFDAFNQPNWLALSPINFIEVRLNTQLSFFCIHIFFFSPSVFICLQCKHLCPLTKLKMWHHLDLEFRPPIPSGWTNQQN
jgi:hypothetical protein